jgi:hypothetical protein
MDHDYTELLTFRTVLTNTEQESESGLIRRARFEASTSDLTEQYMPFSTVAFEPKSALLHLSGSKIKIHPATAPETVQLHLH